jgi:hypothetical protein
MADLKKDYKKDLKKTYRFLRGYTLDPGFSTSLNTMDINETLYRIRWEDLTTTTDKVTVPSYGPCGEYFEVIDIDPPSQCYYAPVDLNSVDVLSQNGLKPSEGNPQFHQQFVYTIAMKILEQFERSLGRRMIWSPRRVPAPQYKEYVAQIRLYPHALREANAYYDTQKKAILFGYFKAAPQISGNNFPGGAVFTCLSADIIAHEVTHALVDSLHPRFLENTNRDVGAFHEAFSDIIALLQRFTTKELIIDQLSKTSGSLDKFNFLGELATQLGSALPHGRGALRSAIGEYVDKKWQRIQPDPTKYQTVTEVHERGAILVATFFDALIKIYNYRTADLIRIASNGTGKLPEGAISRDLAARLADEVCTISTHLTHIAIRALDYCPPIDINFGDFLRALITADVEFSDADTNIYRIALIDAFRSWGIFPLNVNTLSEESLVWNRPNLEDARIGNAVVAMVNFLREKVPVLNGINDRKAIWEKSLEIQRDLHEFLINTKKVSLGPEDWEKWLKHLGISSEPLEFPGYSIVWPKDHTSETSPIEVYKVKPAYRIGSDGLVLEQIIVTITQKVILRKKGEEDAEQNFVFRGGSTIIFDRTKDFSLSYIITKNIRSNKRLNDQVAYQTGNDEDASFFTDSLYEENDGMNTINFSHLHFH